DKSLKAGLPDGSIFINIGEIYLKKGDLEKAETFYLKILNLDKGKEFYFDDIASFYLKKGNLKESWKYLKESFIIWFEDEDLWEKIEPYKQYLSEDNFYAHVSVGCIYYSFQKYKEAIEHFEKALKLNKSEFDQYYRLGMSYIKIVKYKKAVSYLEEALKRNPNHYGTNLQLGIIYGFSNFFANWSDINTDYKRSVELLEKAKQINPGNKDPYYHLGSTYQLMKKYYDALRETRKALDIEKNVSTLMQMGYIYTEMQDYKMALEYYNQSLALLDTYFTRKCIIETLINLKEYNKAKDFIKESIVANPDYADFKIKLCDVFFEEGEYLSAIKLYKDYLKKEEPNNSHAHFYIALSYLRLQNWDESEFWWKKHIDIEPKEPTAFYNLGILYYSTAKYDKAIKNFNKYLKFNPNSDDAKSLIEFCQYQIDLEKLPEKLRELSRREGDIGNLGKLLTCVTEHRKAHDLLNDGEKETTPKYEMIGSKKILTSYNVSSKIYESQGHFEKIVSDLNRIKSSNKEINEVTRLLVFAAEQSIAGIEEYSKCFYIKAKDYKGEYEKGKAKIKLANTYFVDSLKIIRFEVVKNKSVFDKFILEFIDSNIKYFSSN
ncbi:MAG: tetratricopeptide repeat protein, partial [Proteobacteria bacterium]|nr:tetratricopeptide repeat protein [Pseudomonadota bacterium]